MARVERVARLTRLNEVARVGEGERGSARWASVELSRHPFLY